METESLHHLNFVDHVQLQSNKLASNVNVEEMLIVLTILLCMLTVNICEQQTSHLCLGVTETETCMTEHRNIFTS